MNYKSIAKNINKFVRDIRYTFYIIFISFNKKKIFDKNNLSPQNNPLTFSMNKYYSDKGNLNNVHDYTKFYHSLFNKISTKKLKIFEVGLGSVDTDVTFHMKFSNQNYEPLASLKAWREYFLNSEIYGADIDKKILENSDRIKTFYVDMLSEKSIISMWKNVNEKMDIIIDDGFHSFEANINFFKNSYKMLNKDGYYIIEDIHRKPSNMKKFNKFFKIAGVEFQIIDLPHKNNINDNCLILITKN